MKLSQMDLLTSWSKGKVSKVFTQKLKILLMAKFLACPIFMHKYSVGQKSDRLPFFIL